MSNQQDIPAPSPRRILLVDDDEDIRCMIDMSLKSEDYLLDLAASGDECLLKVKDCRPDLILLDIMMPIMDGLHVARILKANPYTASIPIIIFSVLNPQEYITDTLAELGVEDIIAKPFEEGELMAKIRKVIG